MKQRDNSRHLCIYYSLLIRSLVAEAAGASRGAEVRAVALSNASASPPYLFGNSPASITGVKAAARVLVPLPTTLILAKVFADKTDLKNQNTHVSIEGTLTKNLRAYFASCLFSYSEKRQLC